MEVASQQEPESNGTPFAVMQDRGNSLSLSSPVPVAPRTKPESLSMRYIRTAQAAPTHPRTTHAFVSYASVRTFQRSSTGAATMRGTIGSESAETGRQTTFEGTANLLTSSLVNASSLCLWFPLLAHEEDADRPMTTASAHVSGCLCCLLVLDATSKRIGEKAGTKYRPSQATPRLAFAAFSSMTTSWCVSSPTLASLQICVLTLVSSTRAAGDGIVRPEVCTSARFSDPTVAARAGGAHRGRDVPQIRPQHPPLGLARSHSQEYVPSLPQQCNECRVLM
jgi:hypothetical protein